MDELETYPLWHAYAPSGGAVSLAIESMARRPDVLVPVALAAAERVCSRALKDRKAYAYLLQPAISGMSSGLTLLRRGVLNPEAWDQLCSEIRTAECRIRALPDLQLKLALCEVSDVIVVALRACQSAVEGSPQRTNLVPAVYRTLSIAACYLGETEERTRQIADFDVAVGLKAR